MKLLRNLHIYSTMPYHRSCKIQKTTVKANQKDYFDKKVLNAKQGIPFSTIQHGYFILP